MKTQQEISAKAHELIPEITKFLNERLEGWGDGIDHLRTAFALGQAMARAAVATLDLSKGIPKNNKEKGS